MFSADIFVWWPVITILLMSPLLCWYDLKCRSIPNWCFSLILLINIPVLIWQYITGTYGWEEMVVTFLPCLIYYGIMRLAGDYFHGDDLIYVWAISLFCVVNPLNPNEGALAVKVMIYLVGVMILALGVNGIYNALKGEGNSIIEIFNKCNRGFPLIIPIAVAFFLAVVI
jgi:hypothetical protein